MGHTEITRIHTKNNPWIQKLNFSGPLEFQDPQNFCILDKEEKTEKNKIKNEQKIFQFQNSQIIGNYSGLPFSYLNVEFVFVEKAFRGILMDTLTSQAPTLH